MLGTLSILWNNSVLAVQTSHGKCFKVGETITVIGKANRSINGGTYFPLLKPICVYYPKSPMSTSTLSTLGNDRLQPNIYLKITGVLHDGHERGIVGFDIDVKDAINVDEEINAEKEAAKQSCEKWQADNSPALSKKAHGSKVGWIFDENEPKRCSIWAVDNEMPHRSIYVHRPESKK